MKKGHDCFQDLLTEERDLLITKRQLYAKFEGSKLKTRPKSYNTNKPNYTHTFNRD